MHPIPAISECAGVSQMIRANVATMTINQNSHGSTSASFDRRGWLKSIVSSAVLARFDGIFPLAFNASLSRKEKVNQQKGQHAVNQTESMASLWLEPQIGFQWRTS